MAKKEINFPPTIPFWIISHIYGSLAQWGCVAETISVHCNVEDNYDFGITGGSPSLNPLHNHYPDYISLHSFIDKVIEKSKYE